MKFETLTPTNPKSIKNILETAMLQQNVNKELKWIIVHGIITKKEAKQLGYKQK